MLDCPKCEEGLMVYLKPEYETLSGRQTVVQYPAMWECNKCNYILQGVTTLTNRCVWCNDRNVTVYTSELSQDHKTMEYLCMSCYTQRKPEERKNLNEI